jgi:hypothetical protein
VTITLKSGRTVYANRGIFGLCEDGDGFSVTEGHDGSVPWPRPEWEDADASDLTADDMREIADLMLERLARFRASLPAS